MKKKLILMFTILNVGFGFAAEDSAHNWVHGKQIEPTTSLILDERVDESRPAKPDRVANFAADLVAEKLSSKDAHVYLRMNVIEPSVGRKNPLIPGIGLGYRRAIGDSALDFSAAYSQGRGSHNGKSEFITFPRVAYLYYFSPIKERSVYIGPAIALGRVKTGAGHRFDGLIPSMSAGYELSHRKTMLSFFQLDMSLPFIGSKLTGPFPGLILEFAFGAGF